MITTIIVIIIGIIIGIALNRILFGIWHKGAHSKKLRLEEDIQKEKEWEELHDKRDKEGSE